MLKLKQQQKRNSAKNLNFFFCSTVLLFYHFMMGVNGNRQQSQDPIKAEIIIPFSQETVIFNIFFLFASHCTYGRQNQVIPSIGFFWFF